MGGAHLAPHTAIPPPEDFLVQLLTCRDGGPHLIPIATSPQHIPNLSRLCPKRVQHLVDAPLASFVQMDHNQTNDALELQSLHAKIMHTSPDMICGAFDIKFSR